MRDSLSLSLSFINNYFFLVGGRREGGGGGDLKKQKKLFSHNFGGKNPSTHSSLFSLLIFVLKGKSTNLCVKIIHCHFPAIFLP
jgi:hypothetical protein